MYDSRTIKLTSAGKSFWGTKKHTMRIICVDKPVELSGGYWDGGSRSEYCGQMLSGTRVGLSYPTSPREYGGGVAPSVMPTAEMCIVKSGTFCGKDAGVTAYVSTFEGWMDPKFGVEKSKLTLV